MSIKAMQHRVLQQNIDWKGASVGFASNTLGSIFGALSILLFILPAGQVTGGVTGITLILKELFGLPVGLMTILINIPIMYLGYKMLPGGWKMIGGTIYNVVLYSVAIDILAPFVSTTEVTNDPLLSAIFGGILMGLSSGFVFRTGATFASTSVIALIMQRKTGLAMSNTILYTDVLIISAGGLIFGWEIVLYALIFLFAMGISTDYILEGPSVVRTVTIVTTKPNQVANAIMSQMARGVTYWEGTGMYTGSPRSILFVTVSRAQMGEIKQIVVDADEYAFLVIGQGHTAYGGGFRPVRPSRVPKYYTHESEADEQQATPTTTDWVPTPVYSGPIGEQTTDPSDRGHIAASTAQPFE